MLRNTYRTSVTRVELHEWLDRKAAQRQGFLIKIRLYRTKKLSDGFRIQEIKTGKFVTCPPRITARLIASGKLEVTIGPNRTGLVAFFVIPALFLILIGIAENGNGILKLIPGMVFFSLILAFITFITVFWPMFDARKWIERELNLDREKP